MQARASQIPTPKAQGGAAYIVEATAVSSFMQGDSVFHTKFGYGDVIGVEGDKLEINFDKAGVKKVVARFIVSAADADNIQF